VRRERVMCSTMGRLFRSAGELMVRLCARPPVTWMVRLREAVFELGCIDGGDKGDGGAIERIGEECWLLGCTS